MPCSAAHEATWAWWCWTAIRRSAGNRATAYFVDRYSGWRSWATTSGSSARSRERCASPSVKARWVARSSRSPLCGATWARAPRASVNVCLSSAPTASRGTGVATGRGIGSGSVAARPPHDRLAPGHHPGHRVVVAGPDLAVVGQECVGEAGQPADRVRVVGRQRLVGQVAGGEHERPADGLEEQVVERRVRQEDPEAAIPGGHGRRQRGVPSAGLATRRTIGRAGPVSRRRSSAPTRAQRPRPRRRPGP